jgi:hypothetical protein
LPAVRIASKTLPIAIALLLIASSAKAAEGILGNLTPSFYFFNPASIARTLDSQKPASDAAAFVHAFCQGKCAATIYVGLENETGQGSMLGTSHFVPPYRYQFAANQFVGGTLSRVLAEVGNGAMGSLLAIEIEIGAGQRFGNLHETEGWAALYLRWKYFPWNDYLRTTVAVSTGLNYASAISEEEYLESGNGKGARLLHYFSPEITVALPSRPDRELVIRNHHRSGGGGIYGYRMPVYGSLFHGTDGGTQFLSVGLRQHF